MGGDKRLFKEDIYMMPFSLSGFGGMIYN